MEISTAQQHPLPDMATSAAQSDHLYEDVHHSRALRRLIVACIPNGILQDCYNPSADDGIWLAGRNAPSLGEDFRVRLSYNRLRSKASWRVQEIPLQEGIRPHA